MKRVLIFVLTLLTAAMGSVGFAEETPKTTGDIDDKTVSVNYISEVEYPYTYTDAAGREITIEHQITAIAVDYLPLWESMTLLGVKPVAASGSENYIATWDAFDGYDFSTVTDIGSSEINLELLAALEPDLILAQVWDVNDMDIANYEKIATVAVFSMDTKMDWRLSLREVGKLLGLSQRAEEVIAQVEERLAASRELIKEEYQDQTVMQISIMGEDKYYCAWREDLYGETGLGLKTPEGYTTSTNYEQISMEAIAQMNPDVIFINLFDGDEAIYEAMTANSVWQSLTAVKNGRVYLLDGTGHANSALSTLHTVDFIVESLTQAE